MPRCSLCNRFERNPRDHRVAFDSEPNQLDTSARAGCPICGFIRNGIAYFEPRFSTFSRVRRVYVWGSTVDGGGSVKVDLYLDDSTKLRLEFFVGAGKIPFLFRHKLSISVEFEMPLLLRLIRSTCCRLMCLIEVTPLDQIPPVHSET